MARYKIQFQKGLSEVAFQESYGTEAQCQAVLEAMRWPKGFALDASTKGHRTICLQCADCRRQISLTAGTIFEHIKVTIFSRHVPPHTVEAAMEHWA